MNEAPRTLLAKLVSELSLSREEQVAALESLARRMGEVDATFSLRQFDRWLTGEVAHPRTATRRVLQEFYGRTVDALFGAPYQIEEVHEAPSMYRAALHDLEEVAMSAAHDSSEHSAIAATSIADSSIEDLQERVMDAARGYSSTLPIAMFGKLVRIRNQAWRDGERTKRPKQIEDLYVVAGQACALLATITFDLGYPEAAAEQARSATTYGQAAGHRTLAAFGLAVQSTIAFWTGEPRRGVRLATNGLEIGDSGTVAIRLHGLRARSHALQGQTDEAKADLLAADHARQDAGDDPLCDDIGGEFGFSEARLALCSAASYVALHDGGEAARQARRAIDLFVDLPEPERRFSVQHGARLDLVAGLVIEGDLNQAAEEMQPVLALLPEQRTRRLTERVNALRTATIRPEHRDARAGRQLRDMMEDFVAGADRPALPGVPG